MAEGGAKAENGTMDEDTEPGQGSPAQSRPDSVPDAERKPAGLTEITPEVWKFVARKTVREFVKDRCPDLAAGLTFYSVLSLFPALLVLVALLGVFGQAEQTAGQLLEIVRGIAPETAVDIIRRPLEELISSPSAGLTLVVGLLSALWTASGYVGAFARAMNRIYEIDEGRPFPKRRGTMLAVTVVLVLIVAALAAMLVLTGPVARAVGSAVGLGGAFLAAWNVLKWPVMAALVVTNIAILYYATPNIEQPKFRWVSLGSLVALAVSVLASLGFAFYVSNFGSYNATYGAIGGVIVMLLWLWILNMSLLFGAEFDAELERGRQLQVGIKSEETLQLPPRDTEHIKKRRERRKEDVRRGRELRLQHAAGPSDRQSEDQPGGSPAHHPDGRPGGSSGDGSGPRPGAQSP